VSETRVVHYINQFFAGIGGEDRADVGPGVVEGPKGPGLVLQKALQGAGEVVATIYCGDNYANEFEEKARDAFVEYLRRYRPDVVLAGPAFTSGRYGLACGLVCVVARELGIPAISAMHPENPAVELYRSRVHIAPTAATTAEMLDAMSRASALALKLAGDQPIGPAAEEGYLSRGLRYNQVASDDVGVRTVDMLMKRLRGEDFDTEWLVPTYDRVRPAPPLDALDRSTLAIVTSGGVVPKGNRDGLQSARATRWYSYSIAGRASLSCEDWESIHGGFDTTHANRDPNRIVPLDVLREFEARGAFARLADTMYVTTGNQSGLENAIRFGEEISDELVKTGVDGVLFVAT
jgi:glycine reductase